MTENEKKLEQARHRLEEAEMRDRVKERKARTHRLIVHGAALENVFPDTKAMSEDELKIYLSNLIKTNLSGVLGTQNARLFPRRARLLTTCRRQVVVSLTAGVPPTVSANGVLAGGSVNSLTLIDRTAEQQPFHDCTALIISMPNERLLICSAVCQKCSPNIFGNYGRTTQLPPIFFFRKRNKNSLHGRRKGVQLACKL